MNTDDVNPMTPCRQCKTPKRADRDYCDYCAARLPPSATAGTRLAEEAAARYERSVLTHWPAAAMLTFPIWGIGLLGSLAKVADFPGFIPLGMFIAFFSPLPIVLNERFGVLATIALVIAYYSLAVPVAILVLLLVGGQA